MRLENKIQVNSLYRVKSNHDKWKKYFDFASIYTENVDYENILSENNFKNFYSELEENYNLSIKYDKEYSFTNRYFKHINFLDSLSSCKINGLAYKAFLEVEKNETIRSILKSFKPFRSFTNNVKYNVNSNVTGRLTVKKGPNILTLPKRCRSILDSRFSGGSVLGVDFNALEPRLCLKLSGKDIQTDLYEEINNLLDFDIDRSVIKRAIISVLYGAHYTSLKGLSPVKSKELFESIHKFFNLDYILELSTNIDKHEIRRNYFGRPLWNLEEERENILINNYIQSSAVDLALTYFSELAEIIDAEMAVPIFVLHDAIIFDVSPEYREELEKIVNKGYNHEKLGYFPLKTEIFNTTSQES